MFEGHLLKSLPGSLVRNVLTRKNFTSPTNPLALLPTQNSFSKDFVAKGLAVQRVVFGPTAPASFREHARNADSHVPQQTC